MPANRGCIMWSHYSNQPGRKQRGVYGPSGDGRPAGHGVCSDYESRELHSGAGGEIGIIERVSAILYPFNLKLSTKDPFLTFQQSGRVPECPQRGFSGYSAVFIQSHQCV